MITIKLKEKEIQLLREKEQKIYNLQIQLGGITYEKLILKEAEKSISTMITGTLQEEDKILEDYIKEHGKGEVDLDKGEFTVPD